MKTRAGFYLGISVAALALWTQPVWSITNVYLLEVPDYGWYYGCMGTAAGNLMGYWDRHGFPDFYTGRVNGGVAPLNSDGANVDIISLWVSRAGVDGRPANKPGHAEDYYQSFESTGPDPYLALGRPEHPPDCIADFIGMDQMKWTNLGGECNGNIDGYCYVYWDTNGDKRVNFRPGIAAGTPALDVQSGFRDWTQYRGYDCTVFSQLVDFNTNQPPGKGFSFDDLKAEIDSGYPVILFLQRNGQTSRNIGSVTSINPEIHSMLAYGYYVPNSGTRYVRYRTSWASGPSVISAWGPQAWQADLPVRGVIGYHPLPRIRQTSISPEGVYLRWDGPAADLYDAAAGTTNRVHGYVVELSPDLSAADFAPVSPTLLTNSYTILNCPTPAFLRVKLVKP